jgi:hypothetical protein
MSPAVVFTVSCQRRSYLDRTLRAWKLVRGMGQAPVVLALEHYQPWRKGEADLAMAEKQEFTGFEWQVAQLFPQARVVRNTVHLGCLRNTAKAMELGFTHSDFVVCAEEDIDVADDTLEYFAWAAEHYRHSGSVLAVCAHSVASGGTPADVARVPWFTPLVWGTWADRWAEAMAPAWHPVEGLPQGWDYRIRKLVEETGSYCVYPAQSRAQHFGARSTMTPCSPVSRSNQFHDRSQSRSFHHHYDKQDYAEGMYRQLALEYY